MPLAAPFAMTLPPATESAEADLGALFELHGRRLYRLARRLAGDAAEAEDLVQEAFLRAARIGRGGYGGRALPAEPAGAEAWLVRTLVRLAHDRFRRRRVRSAAEPSLAEDDLAPDDPESAALARRDVRRALAALPPRRRAVVVLYELEERDTNEIAELLGIARVTVRWHLAAGRRELARRLGKRTGIDAGAKGEGR